jgi:hypothetical protein
MSNGIWEEEGDRGEAGVSNWEEKREKLGKTIVRIWT